MLQAADEIVPSNDDEDGPAPPGDFCERRRRNATSSALRSTDARRCGRLPDEPSARHASVGGAVVSGSVIGSRADRGERRFGTGGLPGAIDLGRAAERYAWRSTGARMWVAPC